MRIGGGEILPILNGEIMPKLESRFLFAKFGQMGPNSLNAYSAWGHTDIRTAVLMGEGPLFVVFEGDAMVNMIDVSKPLLKYGIARLLEETKGDKYARRLVKATLAYHLGKLPIEELHKVRKRTARRAKRLSAEKNQTIDPRSKLGLALRGCSLNAITVVQATVMDKMEFRAKELVTLMHQYSERFYKRLAIP